MGKNERTQSHQALLRNKANSLVKPAINSVKEPIIISGDISNISPKVVEELVKAVEKSDLFDKIDEPNLSVENTVQDNPETYVDHSNKSRKCKPCEQARIQTEKIKKLAKKRKGVKVKTDIILDNNGKTIL